MLTVNRQGARVVGRVFYGEARERIVSAPTLGPSRRGVFARVLLGTLLSAAAILVWHALFGGDVRWGASGIGGAAFLKNLPQDGSYQLNEQAFNHETERNDVNLPSVPFTVGQGSPIDVRIPNVGILANVKLVFQGSITIAAGGATPGYQFPWNIFKRLTLNANGQTSLISAEGLDFRARTQRVFRNPKGDFHNAGVSIDANGDPTNFAMAAGNQPLFLSWDFPIVHDDESLAGALFAQSDQNYLNLRIQPGAIGELFAVNAGNVTGVQGTITPVLTYFDIPLVQDGNGHDVVLIPDLRWLHGFLSQDKPYSNVGTVSTQLTRTSGQLLALMAYLDVGPAGQVQPFVLNEIRWVYGANRKPRATIPFALMQKNQRDYSGLVRPGYFVFDFEVDNPARDLVYPKGLTELGVEVDIPLNGTIGANARFHTVLDSLYMGV